MTVANDGMSEEVASSFMLKQGHIKTTIKVITGENEELLGTSEYNFDEKYLIEDKYVAISNKTIHNFYTNDNGYAKYIGVGPDNQVATSYYGEWNSFTFPFASLNTTQFRQTGEHTYSYLGFDSHNVACDLAWASVGDYQIAYITAHEENGKIVSFTCETANELVDISTDPNVTEYAFSKLVMEVEVLPYETIEDPKPFEADADTVRIKAYLDELNGENANFTMFMGDHAKTSDWKTIKVTDGLILVQEYKDSSLSGYYGYYRFEDGSIAKFSAKTENNVVIAKFEGDVELAEGKTFASLLGFNIAPETMSFDVDGNIVFKDGVMNAGNGLFNEFKYRQSAIANTIVFKVNGGHITGIDYSYASGANTSEYTMNYGYGTTALTSTFETELLTVLPNIKGTTPTTWEEEDPEILANLTTLLGDYASQIPYVYDPQFSGHYTSSVYSATTVYIKVPTSTPYSDSYKTAFIAACVENGFTKNSEKKATKVVGDKSIIVQFISATLAVQYK